jgi:bifunctional UDP-N-acetylglucosamine pyrophosphorylase / glucosamine-1-phosphate N-acetyltransferase
MHVVVLAAGQGKRMRSALPKVLQPIAGLPLLGHVLSTARSLGAAKLCVVYGHGGEQVRAALDAPDLAWALQAEQLGTGHAVAQALPHLPESGPVLILYGDVPLTRRETLAGLVEAAGTDGFALLTVDMDDPTGYGRIVRDAAHRVTRIVEHKDASEAERKIRNENAQGEYYLPDIIAMAVADGIEVKTSQPLAVWETLGVNDKAQLAELERMHQRNQAQALLVAGVTLIDPARIDIRGTLETGRDVEIDVNCVFEGAVVLGEGVKIGANCVIKNVSIAAGAVIHPFSHLEGAEVGAKSLIGPFARLRPGTKLAEEVHIGNFTEVKNSNIAANSKANHLAYIGDADIGSKVNVGAGTITCNYDGANKFRTVIEDEVFIGSDTQLVAPVRVGKGATLGAGTTLTKDAPAGQLTLSRAKQMTVPGWSRPVKLPK